MFPLSLLLTSVSVYLHHSWWGCGTVTCRRESLGTAGDTEPWHQEASPDKGNPASPCAQRAWPAAQHSPAEPWVTRGQGQSSSEGNFGAGSRAHGANPLLHFKGFITKFNTDLERQSLIQRQWKTIRRSSLLSLKLSWVPTQLEFHSPSAAASDTDRLWHTPSRN